MLEWIDLIKCVLIVIGALVYFVVPIDLLPDFIPVAGRVDDLVIVLSAIPSLVKLYARFKEEKKPEPGA